MNGEEFLNVAIRPSARADEASPRSSVSRAYYGVFHLARGFVRECGVQLPKTGDVHSKLQWCLQRSEDARVTEAAAIVSMLRKARNSADYDLTASEFRHRAHASQFLAGARRFTAILAEVRASPRFDETRDEIRRYAADTLRLPLADD